MAQSRLDWLKDQRELLRSQLATLNSKLRTDYSIDGQGFQWSQTRRAYMEDLKAIEEEIALLENGGEYITEAYSA